MLIRVSNFAGMSPSTNEKLLGDNASTEAINCYFAGGTVGSWRQLKSVGVSYPGIKSMYKLGQNLSLTAPDYDAKLWKTWSTDVDVVSSQVAANTSEQIYYSDVTQDTERLYGKTSYDREYSSLAAFPVGVDVPGTPLTTAVSGTGEGTAENRYYFYTYVNTFENTLEESLPSEATEVQNGVLDGQTITVTRSSDATLNGNITHWRLYRTASGSSATDFQLVPATWQQQDASGNLVTVTGYDIPISTLIVTDAATQDQLAEVCPSIEWDPPPVGLKGFVNLPNGIIAGFKDNDIYFCEPYRPFTFPSKYTLTVDYKIVGLGVVGATLVVVTQGYPYIATGIDPSAMSLQKLEVQQACVSKRSIVSMGFGVVYASPDGLVLVDGNGVKVITEDLITRRDWQSLVNPSTLTACQYEGRYYFWNTTEGWVLDFKAGLSKLDILATAAFNDVRNDSLYIAVDSQIQKWDGEEGTSLEYSWKSKVFETPKPLNFGFAQVLLEDGSVTLEVYAGGTLRYTKVITDDLIFRLPSGFLEKYWQIRIAGTGTVRGVLLAQTIQELQSV